MLSHCIFILLNLGSGIFHRFSGHCDCPAGLDAKYKWSSGGWKDQYEQTEEEDWEFDAENPTAFDQWLINNNVSRVT